MWIYYVKMHILNKIHTKYFELGNRLHVFVSIYIFKRTQTTTSKVFVVSFRFVLVSTVTFYVRMDERIQHLWIYLIYFQVLNILDFILLNICILGLHCSRCGIVTISHYSFLFHHLPENGQCRPKHVGGVSYI
jgi:hypothetical protein